ncbi:hypothetical protein [Sphingomonas sp. PP-CE-3G-477]|uniref:hypothetical protein n=1 Tax=Sphingomonas sp. PP-CE-3G-477 TaxID=2135660 RepID=UPI0011B271A8|nr:hypothetical protein [Sphingomonas sp. PP-CE-3G-477]
MRTSFEYYRAIDIAADRERVKSKLTMPTFGFAGAMARWKSSFSASPLMLAARRRELRARVSEEAPHTVVTLSMPLLESYGVQASHCPKMRDGRLAMTPFGILSANRRISFGSRRSQARAECESSG